MTTPSLPDGGPAGWIDSHCHLQDVYRTGGPGVDEAVVEAVACGVRGLVCVGTDATTSRQAIGLASGIRSTSGPFGAWATVGLHPHDASHGVDEIAAMLGDELAASGGSGVVVAVGECGLDYHYDHSPQATQRDAFAAQIGLARRHGLALVVHSRAAWDDTIDILRAEDMPERTVIHCFSGGATEARRCLDLGAYLSFSGIVTFKNADDVRDAATLCPLDRLLVETDAPFLSPVPFRGEQNRPSRVAVVGEAVAALKGLNPEELSEISSSVAIAAFALR